MKTETRGLPSGANPFGSAVKVKVCFSISKTSGVKVQTPCLDTVGTGSGGDLVSDQHAISPKILTPVIDQVATAPCTDCVQARRPEFEATHLQILWLGREGAAVFTPFTGVDHLH